MKNTLDFGFWAENYAKEYLVDKGYDVLERNYRKPWGEIDLIVEKGGIIVFVEVKASKDDIEGFEPENRVNREKLARMNRAIQTYLVSKKYSSNQDWQIDIVSIAINQKRGAVKIRHFKNIEI